MVNATRAFTQGLTGSEHADALANMLLLDATLPPSVTSVLDVATGENTIAIITDLGEVYMRGAADVRSVGLRPAVGPRRERRVARVAQ